LGTVTGATAVESVGGVVVVVAAPLVPPPLLLVAIPLVLVVVVVAAVVVLVAAVVVVVDASFGTFVWVLRTTRTIRRCWMTAAEARGKGCA
jgi:phage-related minor tail protein